MEDFQARSASMVGRVFAHFASESMFEASDGSEVTPVRSVLSNEDVSGLETMFASVRQDSIVIALLVSELPTGPQSGDRVTRPEGQYQVIEQAKRSTSFGFVWMAPVKSLGTSAT